VGDVQGCAGELEQLLARARAAFGEEFELWMVGDLVNRGPFSRRVLEIVRKLVEAGRARLVLGNHELSMIATYLGIRPARPTDTFAEILRTADAVHWVEWIRRRPLVETGHLHGRPFVVVHAAVHPDWDLQKLRSRAEGAERWLARSELPALKRFLETPPGEDSDRDALALLTTCRSVNADGSWSSEPPALPEDAWHRRWGERHHAYGVVYGHWSLQGLHVAPGLRGLDTGCVHHGRGRTGYLTAWVPDLELEDPFALPDSRFWQVEAKRRYIGDDGVPLRIAAF
jgi:bis(5'-nucleosyl)-tetraphosphatase (symmetrical)